MIMCAMLIYFEKKKSKNVSYVSREVVLYNAYNNTYVPII